MESVLTLSKWYLKSLFCPENPREGFVKQAPDISLIFKFNCSKSITLVEI